MKKNQFSALLLAAVLVQGSMVMANDKVVNKNEEVHTMTIQETKSAYTMKQGEIVEMTKEGETYSLLVKTAVDEIQFNLNQNQIIMDADKAQLIQVDELKKGMNVTVVIAKNAPMTLSLPAIISCPSAIVVSGNEALVEVSYFNEQLTSETNTLALNVARETNIVSTTGERRIFTEEDLKEKDLVVIYKNVTRSIPPQTTPQMVLILSDDQEDNEVIEEQVELAEPVAEVASGSMRQLAEEKGYKVTWHHEAKTVTLEKGETTFVFTLGQKQYTYNGKTQQLSEAIKVVNNSIYASDEVSNLL